MMKPFDPMANRQSFTLEDHDLGDPDIDDLLTFDSGPVNAGSPSSEQFFNSTHTYMGSSNHHALQQIDFLDDFVGLLSSSQFDQPLEIHSPDNTLLSHYMPQLPNSMDDFAATSSPGQANQARSHSLGIRHPIHHTDLQGNVLDSICGVPSPDGSSLNMNAPSQHASSSQRQKHLASQSTPVIEALPSPPKGQRRSSRKDNPLPNGQGSPKKKTRGKAKYKKLQTPHEIEIKNNERLANNRKAASKCRVKKKIDLDSKVNKANRLVINNQELWQEIQLQIDECLKLRPMSHKLALQSPDEAQRSQFMTVVQSIDTRLEGLYQQRMTFEEQVALINSEVDQYSGPEKGQRKDPSTTMKLQNGGASQFSNFSEQGDVQDPSSSMVFGGVAEFSPLLQSPFVSTTPKIGGIPQSRNNSMQSNGSRKSQLHDSGVSDLDTPGEPKNDSLGFHRPMQSNQPEISAHYGPYPNDANGGYHSHSQMMSNQRFYGQAENFASESYSSLESHQMAQGMILPYLVTPGRTLILPALQHPDLNGSEMLEPAAYLAQQSPSRGPEPLITNNGCSGVL